MVSAHRVVTVLTSDLKGSTSLGERLDPESLREILSLYFEAMAAVITTSGGTVEKISGDAIMAIFEDPASTGDAAARGVRAAAETRTALVGLNDRLEARWGVRLTNRTGVATGALVAGVASDDEHILTGSLMTLATALEQAAPADGVLVDAATMALVADLVDVEVAADVRPKGSRAAVPAFQLITVQPADVPRVAAAADPSVAVQRDSRKTVTILFADLDPSRLDGEPIDADVQRDVMGRIFEPIRSVLQGHGATVEKFIGDAVMAVFGLPVRHEDDALRAVRAAMDLGQTIDDLGPGLAADLGVRLHVAIGINSGPVVAGDASLGQRLATGDAVNVAARLEQSASAGTILIGELTRRLVGAAVDLDEIEPLTLKGKAAAVRAFRVTGLAAARPAAGPQTVMVGRETELARLRDAFDGARAARRTRMMTVIGDAGVGKTRLTEAFLDLAAPVARILRGRCLPYGDGITFWPIAEAVRQAASILATDSAAVARDRLDATCDDPDVVDRVASALGISTTSYQVAELFWGIRRYLEVLAADRPLVVVLDDIHWAEGTFRDLIEHLVTAGRSAPILVLCGSRATLLEDAPDWATDDGSARIVLSALGDADAARVADGLLGSADLDPAVRQRIITAAEGNPLFIEQMLAMLMEDGSIELRDGAWRQAGDLSTMAIPPSIHALLAARLDQLPADERAVADPASVIGLQFAHAALETIVEPPVRPILDQSLTALRGKQLVRPIADLSSTGASYRFGHILIRDAAYEGLLKRKRADLHERFVAWADEANRAAGRANEFDEILGYHLEQAHRYLAELGPLDAHGISLGVGASSRLASAGRRAADRGDVGAAMNLLRRAAAALPSDAADRPRLLLQLGDATFESGDHEAADVIFADAADLAERQGDATLATTARLAALQSTYLTDPSAIDGPVAPRVRAALATLEAAGDHAGQARAWQFLGNLEYAAARWSAAAAAIGEVIRLARLADDPVLEVRVGPFLAIFATEGATPVSEAIELAESVLAGSTTDRKAQAYTERALARLHALAGDFGRARSECDRARRTLEELGWAFAAALTSIDSAQIEMVAGDAARAERDLRRDYAALEALGDRNFITTVAAFLADATYRQGDDAEADRFAAFSAETADPDDQFTQMLWRQVRARLLSRAGDHDGAVAMAQAAVDLSRESDDLIGQANALRDLSTVLAAAGRADDARAAGTEMTALYEQKGATAYLTVGSRR